MSVGLHGSRGYDRYRAVIRTADGANVWSQERLKSEPLDGSRIVTVTVPANRLSSDDYTITLSGVTSSGQADEVSGYYFRAQVRR